MLLLFANPNGEAPLSQTLPDGLLYLENLRPPWGADWGPPRLSGWHPCSLVWRLARLWEHSPGVHGALVSCSVWWGREILVNTAWEEEWNGQRMRLRNGCVNRQVEGGQGAWEQHSNTHVSNSWWEKALTCRGGRLCRAPGHMCPRGWQGPGHSGIALGAWPVRASLWAWVWKDRLAPHALSAPGKVWFKAKTPELIYLDSLTIFGARKSWDWAARSALGSLCAVGGFYRTATQDRAKRNIRKNWLKLCCPTSLLSSQESTMVPALQSNHI